jgi:hypothetical protein
MVARAELPENAPVECREQVAAAVSALRPVLHAQCTLERAILAYVPGRFHAVDEGVLPQSRSSGACPSGMADVAHRFCIDRWEGSLAERRADGSEVAWSPFAAPADGHVYVARTASGTTPQAYVSAIQADRACRAAGKRLCAPVEWRAACGGTQANAYPYGPARVAGKCHDTGTRGRPPRERPQRSAARSATGYDRQDGCTRRLRECERESAASKDASDWRVVRERLRRLRHGRQPRRMDGRPERHLPRWVLARHHAARRGLRVSNDRTHVRLPRLLDGLPLLRRPRPRGTVGE